MNKAIEAVKAGCIYRGAAEEFDVDHATLYRRFNTTRPSRGRSAALTTDEETLFVSVFVFHANRGIPLT